MSILTISICDIAMKKIVKKENMPDNFLVHVTHVLGEINLELFHATDERISSPILYLLEIILREK